MDIIYPKEINPGEKVCRKLNDFGLSLSTAKTITEGVGPC